MEGKYPLALPKGTILAGQYIIESVLGQGGFGITYKATDYKTKGFVAIKEFFPESMATRTGTTVSPFSGERGESFDYGKDSFLQEAETLAQFIGIDGIVEIHNYFEENGTAYFVMDYVEGISFDEYIKRSGGKVTCEVAEGVLVRIMDALAMVHSKGIVHRDVTPDNIYITNDGKVKLLDFGAARYSLGDKSRSLDVVLKHGFAPKEQYTRHGRQGPFTDVYSVGASFYFALTGRRPPDSIDRLEEDDLVPPSSLGVQISKEKEYAILKAMAVQPGDRYQTMTEFKQGLYSNNVPSARSTNVQSTNVQSNYPGNQQGYVQNRYAYPQNRMNNLQGSNNYPKPQNNYASNVTVPVNNQNRAGTAGKKDNYVVATKKNKKLPVILGIVAGIVVLGLVVTLLVFDKVKSKGTVDSGYNGAEYAEATSEDTGSGYTSTEVTTEPSTTETTTQTTTETTTEEYVEWDVGTFDDQYVNNIANSGYCAYDSTSFGYNCPSDDFKWGALYYQTNENVTKISDDALPSSISYVDNMIAYCSAGELHAIDISTYEETNLFDDFNGWLRNRKYFVEKAWINDKGVLTVVKREDDTFVLSYYSYEHGGAKYYCSMGSSTSAVIYGDYVYYATNYEGENTSICRTKISMFDSDESFETLYKDLQLNGNQCDVNAMAVGNDGIYYSYTYKDGKESGVAVMSPDGNANQEVFWREEQDETVGAINICNSEVYYVVRVENDDGSTECDVRMWDMDKEKDNDSYLYTPENGEILYSIILTDNLLVVYGCTNYEDPSIEQGEYVVKSQKNNIEFKQLYDTK